MIDYKYSCVSLERECFLIQYYSAEFKKFEYETAALRWIISEVDTVAWVLWLR
jgi:hypothetical protein